ncbi:POK9 protein, partial [Mionectes macconnelli]|nr:POK9 protein [Mionectes macconnelli]
QHHCMSTAPGKLQAKCKSQPRPDTSSCRDISAPASLRPATAGSLGLDLAATVETTLATTRPTKISTGVFGPIKIAGQVYGALLLGRSSVTIMGLFVLPGVIDADYSGEIQIMAYTLFPPLVIQKGQRIAQLIPLPQLVKGLQSLSEQSREASGFGSTGLTMLTMDLHTRPKKQVRIEYTGQSIVVEGLLDTGADTSIISPEQWPGNWPSKTTMDTVTGVGGYTLAKRTPLVAVFIEDQRVTTALAIVPLPPGVMCLIGRDVLAQIGVVL